MRTQLVFAVTALFVALPVLAQDNAPQNPNTPIWRRPAGTTTQPAAPAGADSASITPNTSVSAANEITRVTSGPAVLPNQYGQIWREYDISPYTTQVTKKDKPQQALIDWILRETGTDAWFFEPLGVLSADAKTLRVYHTPEMHQRVRHIVDRFVDSKGEQSLFNMRVVTIASPNWRAKAQHLLRPVSVQSQGIEAWLLAKEEAAVLIAELRKRNDYREHSTPSLLIHNGQSEPIASVRPRSYIRAVRPTPGVWPGYQIENAELSEGYSLQFSPLMALDGRTVDAVIKCQIDQVEKLVPVPIDVPATQPRGQRVQIQVPRMSSWRLHERFRWPSNQVLLISCGVIATPSTGKPANSFVLSNPLPKGPPRADALLFIETKGQTSRKLPPGSKVHISGRKYGGRY